MIHFCAAVPYFVGIQDIAQPQQITINHKPTCSCTTQRFAICLKGNVRGYTPICAPPPTLSSAIITA